MKTSYIKATVMLAAVTRDAVCLDLLSATDGRRSVGWCPRSVIHGYDEIRLDRHDRRNPITLRVMSWKAKQLGLWRK